MWKKELIKRTPVGILIAVTLGFISYYFVPAVSAQEIINPITSRSFLELIQTVANDVRTVAMLAAVVAIIVVGFQMVWSAATGNSGGVGTAKTALWWTLGGTAIIVGATVLVDVVVNTIKQL